MKKEKKEKRKRGSPSQGAEARADPSSSSVPALLLRMQTAPLGNAARHRAKPSEGAMNSSCGKLVDANQAMQKKHDLNSGKTKVDAHFRPLNGLYSNRLTWQ